MNSALFQARLATTVIFFINGYAFATWVSRIPSIKEQLALTDGTLGLVLLSMPVGAMISMPVAGQLIRRVGSATFTTVTMCLATLSLALPAFAHSAVALFVAVSILGIFLSALDIGMNAQAVVVERHYGRPVMSSFHAFFSLAEVAGSAVAAWLFAIRASATVHFAGSAIGLLAVGLFCSRYLLKDDQADTLGVEDKSGNLMVALKNKYMMLLSLITFCCFLNEGSVGDWTGIYLKEVHKTAETYTPFGFAAAAACMTTGRLLGDRLRQKFGALPLVSTGSLLAAAGLALALWSPGPVLSIVGFGIVGLGLANVVPIMFTTAGNTKGVASATGIALVSLIGYVGLLAGPTLIGFAADAMTLRVALWIVFVLCLLIAGLSKLTQLIPRNE